MLKNKVASALLSVVIAFGMWLYVITVDNPDYRETISDIPVTFVGETALKENGLVITDVASDSVDITFSGKRSDVLKLGRSNITLKVDLAKIYDAGVHKLEWTTSYPGDVAQNAVTQENRNPEYITVTVEEWERKEIPVNVRFEGNVPEGIFADTENVVKEYSTVMVEGPLAVVDRIEQAQITIDLSEHRESISEYYRYTLVDAQGEPVDAEQIEVNVEQVHLEMRVQYVKDVKLVINLVDGGGATATTTVLTYDPQSIKVAGSEAALEGLEEIVLGTINLAEELEPREITYTIPDLVGVTNLSGLTEVTASISFPNLSMKEFVVEELGTANVPEGMEVEVITKKLTVKVRGPAADVNRLTEEDITATVDFTGAQTGSSTFKVLITFGDSFKTLGVVGSCVATATVTEK